MEKKNITPFSDSRIITILKSVGSKVTKGRYEVLSVLMNAQGPLSLQEIEEKIHDASIDNSTIFRILVSFVSHDILKEVFFNDGKTYYEFNRHVDHHHIKCTQCGLIDEVEACYNKDIEKDALKHSKKFSFISKHSLEFFGVCKLCNKNNL